MTKLEGITCPICGTLGTCEHRCNFCHDKVQWVNKDGVKVINSRTGKSVIHDEYGNPHKCMTGGTKGTGFYKDGKVYVNEKSKDLGDYMKNMARLGADGYWHLWLDGKYRGPVEYAPNDHISWNGGE